MKDINKALPLILPWTSLVNVKKKKKDFSKSFRSLANTNNYWRPNFSYIGIYSAHLVTSWLLVFAQTWKLLTSFIHIYRLHLCQEIGNINVVDVCSLPQMLQFLLFVWDSQILTSGQTSKSLQGKFAIWALNRLNGKIHSVVSNSSDHINTF